MRRKLISIAVGVVACGTGPAVAATPADHLAARPAAMPSQDPAVDLLLRQAALWQSRNRGDLALEALNKLLRIAPAHPDALAQIAFIQLRGDQKQKQEAKLTLDRLRRVRPDHEAIARIESLIRLEGQDRDKLRQARSLAKAGKADAALAALRALYPAGPPTPDLALEYWQLVAETDSGWEAAHAGLQKLVRDYPDNPRYRLALAGHLAARKPDNPEALGIFAEFAKQPPYDKQARAAWRRAMLSLETSASNTALLRQYLEQQTVEDTAVKAHLAAMVQALESRRRLLADPYYRARIDGLAALEAGKLDAAEELLERAHGGRPADVEALGGLGIVRMRQGRHAQAQAYFLEAQRLDRGSDKWPSLLRTARYWGLLREARDAGQAREFNLAESKLRQARELDKREPAAIVALADIHAAQGRTGQAEKTYREALSLAPSDPDAMRGLVALLLRDGREHAAETLLAGLESKQRKEMAQAVNAARATLYKEKADTLLAQKDNDGARAMLERAAAHDRDDPWLRLDLARLYAANQEPARGAALFEELLTRRPDDPSARYAYALYQSGQGRQLDALATLERVAGARRDADMAKLQRRLWVGVASRRALDAYRHGDAASAKKLLSDAEAAIGNDIELALDLADARIDTGDAPRAKAQLARLAANAAAAPASPDWSLRHAQLSLAAGAEAEMPALLASIERMPLSPEQTDALSNLRVSLALRQAEAMRRAGQLPQALRELAAARAASPASFDNPRLLAAEARILRAAGMPERAIANYRRLLAQQPEDLAGEMALIETLIQARQMDEPRARIQRLLPQADASPPDLQADLIAALIDLGDDRRARQLAQSALAANPDNPRLLAYAGELAQRGGKPGAALDYLRHSLASDMTQRDPAALPALSRLEAGDTPASDLIIDPASPSALAAEQEPVGRYRDIAELIDRQTPWLSSAIDHRSRSGSPGKSQYNLTEIPIEWKGPEGRHGRIAFRADIVRVSAGSLDLSSNDPGTRYDRVRFGTVALCEDASNCGGGIRAQSDSGVALNAGIERDGLRLDIGTTPLGFRVANVVGGILKKGDAGPFSYSIDASRRPVTGSLLSYAGALDPNPGHRETWGGVVATGARFGLSLDDGGRQGYWSSFGLHKLSGKNVQDNIRTQLMAGGILRLINENDRLLSLGLTGIYWRDSENAGEYTFGHGGYFSPKIYKSLSLPLTFGQRFARFSYTLRASVSKSRSDTEDADYYPIDAGLQAIRNLRYERDAGSGLSTGRSLSLTWEYQTLPNMFIGGRMELDHSPDYSPNRFLLYLRLTPGKTAAKPVMFPPEPFNPISQY